jgi:WW domain-binding protein 2
VRLVFVAPAANADGLQAFDFPLAYITHDKFNQPIFACNNLAGPLPMVPNVAAMPEVHA